MCVGCQRTWTSLLGLNHHRGSLAMRDTPCELLQNSKEFIWNPVPLVRGSTRWYVLVHTSTSSSGYEAVREMSKLYIPVHTGTYGHMTFLWQYILVCTGMYFSVRGGTSKYKEVHGGTRNSTRRYETVCTGMYWYVLIQGLRFNPARVCCPAAGFAAAILPGR